MEGSPGFEITHAYRAHEDVPALPPVIEAVRLPWITERVKSGEIVRFNRLTELPPEAMDDRASMEDLGIRAKVLIPLSVGGAPLGVLGLGVLREWAWPDDLVRRLVLSAETFGAALMRRKFERLLAESQGFGAALFTSIHGQVAVLDRAGTIVAANEAWAMAARHDDVAFGTPHIGASYLEACRTTVRRGEVEAAAIVRGVTAVLDGTAPSFSAEYRIDGADGERWFELLAEPLLRREGGAVVTRVDHTDRRRAELEAGRSREELAHMNRVSTLGELAASLAHEMNQPLTAIRSNVQVAQRLMRSDSPDLDELREILTDLAHDEDRAGQVIRRLRALFQKGQRERVPLDANELIREVARLLQAEIVIRSASLRTYLNKGLPPIQGDRVQLQQVVLNLALNGLDAMRGLPAGERVLTIRSSLEEAELLIEVEDRGHGIAEADREYVFTPFFTTKATGMGMGLNIARSIVEAHGGSLSLTSKPGAGTSFYVRIPTGLVT
jgi:signal transduction histidine kinase